VVEETQGQAPRLLNVGISAGGMQLPEPAEGLNVQGGGRPSLPVSKEVEERLPVPPHTTWGGAEIGH
jgi:hypothetical protein